MLAAGVIVVFAVAGLLAGRLASEPEPGGAPQTVRAAGLELTAPADWRAEVAPRDLSAIGLVKSIELTPESGPRGAGLIAGRTDGAGPTLLPVALLERLADPPPRAELVRLGAFRAYRYRAVQLRKDRRTLTLYATPTTGGTALIACFGPAGSGTFLADCERVASSLALVRLAALPLEPQPSYAQLLDRTVERLNRTRTAKRRSYRRARTSRGRARAASALARACALAAATVADAPAGPVQRPANARLVVALRRAERAYARLASAARRRDRGAFARARRAVRLRNPALQRALEGVNPPGPAG